MKVKLPFTTDENILELIEKVEKYNLFVEDFDREAYVVLLAITGSESNLQSFMKEYGFTKPIGYYQL